MRRIFAIMHKEFIHLTRDKRTIYLAFFIPIVVMLLIGYAINFDVDKVRLAVYDKCGDKTSREFYSAFLTSGYFQLTHVIYQEREIMPLLEKGNTSAVLIIPSDFSKKIKRGEKSPVQFLIDAVDNYTASIISSYVLPITNRVSSDSLVEYMNRKGKKQILQTSPVDARIRIFFNPMLKSRYSAIPGLIAFVMVIISTFLISMTVAREWENGTIEQLFVSPIKRYEFVLGKFLFYFFLTLIECFLLGIFGHLYFDVPFKGDWLTYTALSVVFLIGTVGVGLLISIISKSLLVAVQLSTMISMFPALLLTGFIYPIKSMPDAIQPISKILPAAYFIESIRMVFLKGTPLSLLMKQAAIMLLIGCVLMLFCFQAFKKRLV